MFSLPHRGTRRWVWVLAGWLVLLVFACTALVAVRGVQRQAELDQARQLLLRQVAQRADQHDAHLTALSAIAVAEPDKHALFREVAATIVRFYPRIQTIGLVPLDTHAEIVSTSPLTPALAEQIRAAAHASQGSAMLLPYPGRPGHYLMVKRSPNNEHVRDAVFLDIDATGLLEEADDFWTRPDVMLALGLPDGQPLVGQADEAPMSTVGSASQPLQLFAGQRSGLAEWLPPMPTALTLVAVTLLYVALLLALRQRRRTRRAVAQAAQSALETRLAHAARVNAMGEMASGMAHELTQPLTAILAQLQASRRLLDRGDAEAVSRILLDTVTQARRASDILGRIRNWSRGQGSAAARVDLCNTLRNVQALLHAEADRCQVQLQMVLPPKAVMVRVDSVEIEQVVFNLVRNAIEACSDMQGRGQVVVSLVDADAQVLLDVQDNGPGVDPEFQPRLFTPFATTRPGGTGLGLSLSQRLVERAGGELALVESVQGARFRVTLPADHFQSEAPV